MAAAKPEKKSVRHEAPLWVRRGFRMFEQVAPPLAVRLAVRAFCTPKQRTPRPEEIELLRTAGRRVIRNGRQKIVVHSWGDGPLVMFHHGWSGNAAQMAPLANRITGFGFRVAVVDARGHGQSPGGQATLPQMGADLCAIGTELGPVHALVGHSMGAMVCARAMQLGLPVSRVVMIAAPAEIMPFARYFQRAFGLSTATLDGMMTVLRSRYQLSPAEATATSLAAGRHEPMLLIHDRLDPDVSMRHPEAWKAAWPGMRLELTEGLGHRRILRDAGVAERVARELGGA